MTHILVRADGSYDRGAIFAKARKELRRGLHDDWSAALSYAWRVAKDQRAAFEARTDRRLSDRAGNIQKRCLSVFRPEMRRYFTCINPGLNSQFAQIRNFAP